MALKKEFILPSGVKGDYWRISAIIFSPNVSLSVNTALYMDQKSRNDEKVEMFSTNVTLPLPSAEELEKNLVSYCYSKMKEAALLSGADDI